MNKDVLYKRSKSDICSSLDVTQTSQTEWKWWLGDISDGSFDGQRDCTSDGMSSDQGDD